MTVAMDPAPQRGGRLGALLDIGAVLATVLALTLVARALHRWLPNGALLVQVGTPVQMLLLIGVATLLLRRRGEGWRALGLARPASWRRVAGLVALGYVGAILVNAVCVLAIFPAFGLKLPNISVLGAIKGDPGAYLYWLVVGWVSAAVGEELMFRGFLWSRLERLFGGGRAGVFAGLVVQGALFGTVHIYQGLGGAIATAGLGLVLGGVCLAGRRNMAANMLLHALIDTVSLTALFLGAVPPAMTH